MLEAMVQLSDSLINRSEPFERLIAEECRKAETAIAFLLRQERIGSAIVDNLNASLQLRAVLADLFLYGEALEPSTDDTPCPTAHDATEVSSDA